MDPVIDIEMTSDAEGPEIEVISAAEGTPEIKVRPYWRHDSSSSSNSIFCAPRHIKYGRETEFEPKSVSIGPHHHGLENLQPMEVTKRRCMLHLLKLKQQSAGGGSNIDRVVPVDPFMKFERRARSFYKNKFKISDVEFVSMLVRDSCFIIRIMLSLFLVKSMGFLEVNMKEVRSDLLLLENQIPLFFINVVYYWLFPDEQKLPPLKKVVKYFVCLDFPWTRSDNCLNFESDHLLDFYWKASVPCKTPLIDIMKQPGGFRLVRPNLADHCRVKKVIVNATELHQTAGIEFYTYGFQIKKEKNIGLHVEFSKGIMRMHCLNIDSSMATLLVNLIAYENSMLSSIRIISTYIKLINDLIDTERDVKLLHKFGIIYNTLSSPTMSRHTKAATFFNEIGNLCLINYKKNHFSDLFRNVDKYYNSSWNRRWANLQDNYFNSPWAGISVFVAGILLILTVLQTFYTIDGYYNPRK